MTNVLHQLARANNALVIAFAGFSVTLAEHISLVVNIITGTITAVAAGYSIAVHRMAMRHAREGDARDEAQNARAVTQNVRDAILGQTAAAQVAQAVAQTAQAVVQAVVQTGRDPDQTTQDARQEAQDTVSRFQKSASGRIILP